VWQLSGKGLPDLLVMARGHMTPCYWLIDVKTPTGGFKPAQIEKWGEALDAGIPIFVCRTPEDVRAVLAGSATPWGRMDAAPARKPKVPKPGVSRARNLDDLCETEHCVTSRALGSMKCVEHQPKAKRGTDGKVPPGAKRTRHPEGCGKWSGGACTCSHGSHGSHGRQSSGYTSPDEKRTWKRAEMLGVYLNGLGAEVMREMMKPSGEENYEAALARSLRAATAAAETFAPCSCTREQPCAACSKVGP